MIAVIALFYAIAIYVLKGVPGIDKLIVLFIYSEPATIGFFFIGLSLIIEKDQNVLSALFVTPVNHHVFLISRLLVLSLLSAVFAVGMVLPVMWGSIVWPHFVAGVFGVSAIFGLLGILMVSHTTDVLHFIIRSIPVLIIMSLPLLNYFELTDFGGFYLFPMQGSLILITQSLNQAPSTSELALGYLIQAAWILVIYAGVFKVFERKAVNAYT